MWTDEDIEKKRYAKAGRPVKNPFPSAEVEKDFAVRGRMMIERYFVPPPQSTLNFVFSKNKKISKTAFWAIIYLHYINTKGVEENLKGFMDAAGNHFGTDVVCDRASVHKHFSKLKNFSVHSIPSDYTPPPSERKSYLKFRSQYHYVTTLWDGLL